MRYIINTLGCKVNQYETQAMETLLRERGHEPAGEGESAELVIVNSCAVTAESGRKSRQALRRLMEHYPGAASAVCGCWAQVEPDAAEALGVDVVWGSGDRRGFVEAAERAVLEKARARGIDKPFERRIIEDLPAGAFSGHARAYLKLEDGCQNFCTYCIIPYARGRVRSLPPERAAQEAAELAARLGELLSLPIDDGLLIRAKKTARQKDLNPAQRLANLEQAFSVPERRKKEGKLPESVILVDDIYTTGSTIEACTRALKAAGVKRVYFVSICIGSER